MSYGLEVYNSSGNTCFTSESKPISIYSSFNTPNRSSSGTQYVTASYPELSGLTIDFQMVASADDSWYNFGFQGQLPILPQVSISYSSGYPVVTATVSAGTRYKTIAAKIYVFLLTPTTSSNYGWQVLNSDNEIISSDFSSNYKLHTKQQAVTPVSLSQNQYYRFLDYRSRNTITAPSYPLIFIENINGQKASVHRIQDNGNGTYTVDIMTDSSSAPMLYIFVKKPTTDTVSGYGISVYDSSGLILWDSNDNVLNPKSYAITQAAGTTDSNNNLDWFWNDTVALTSYGTVPTNSASFCGSNYQGMDQKTIPTGDVYTKGFVSAIKKSNSTIYSGWLANLLASGGYTSQLYNTSISNRVYFIDTTHL